MFAFIGMPGPFELLIIGIIACIFLGVPLAAVVIFLMSRSSKPPDANYVPCPQCGGLLAPQFRFCPYCGKPRQPQ